MSNECKWKYSAWIAMTCMVGVLLSIYALKVELHAEMDPTYEAFCDISYSISCTKVFTSKYGRGFGIIGPIFGETSILNQPNSFSGIFFYIIVGFAGISNSMEAIKLQVVLCTISNFVSVYLAYLLYFVLEDFCIVCVSTYAVNFVNLILSIKRYHIFKLEEQQQQDQQQIDDDKIKSD